MVCAGGNHTNVDARGKCHACGHQVREPEIEIDVIVEADGTITFVHDDDLAAMFEAEAVSVKRASHVEPTQSGQWTADLAPVGGPVLGPYSRRRDALDAETAWLGMQRTLHRVEVQ